MARRNSPLRAKTLCLNHGTDRGTRTGRSCSLSPASLLRFRGTSAWYPATTQTRSPGGSLRLVAIARRPRSRPTRLAEALTEPWLPRLVCKQLSDHQTPSKPICMSRRSCAQLTTRSGGLGGGLNSRFGTLTPKRQDARPLVRGTWRAHLCLSPLRSLQSHPPRRPPTLPS